MDIERVQSHQESAPFLDGNNDQLRLIDSANVNNNYEHLLTAMNASSPLIVDENDTESRAQTKPGEGFLNLERLVIQSNLQARELASQRIDPSAGMATMPPSDIDFLSSNGSLQVSQHIATDNSAFLYKS